MAYYPQKIDEHFSCPEKAGAVEPADAVGASGSFVCGAASQISLRVRDGQIAEARFKAAGCGFLIAGLNSLCEKIAGEEFAEIGKITRIKERDGDACDLFEADFENEFPVSRKHCLELCRETLRAAVDNYRAARLAGWHGDEALICTCFGVSEKTIENVIAENRLSTIEEVTEKCNAGGGCGSCQPLILDILENVWRETN